MTISNTAAAPSPRMSVWVVGDVPSLVTPPEASVQLFPQRRDMRDFLSEEPNINIRLPDILVFGAIPSESPVEGDGQNNWLSEGQMVAHVLTQVSHIKTIRQSQDGSRIVIIPGAEDGEGKRNFSIMQAVQEFTQRQREYYYVRSMTRDSTGLLDLTYLVDEQRTRRVEFD